jgi:AcrR family transcriptional regulator
MAKKKLSGENRKKQIQLCAVKVFARSNYRAAKVADIAAEAGISEALIYKYFPSKKSIFLEILEHMSKRIIIFWQQEVDKEPDALKAMHNMGVTYYKRMIKHPDELKVQFQAISETDDKEIAERLHKDHVNYMRFIRKVIKKGIKQGTIRKNLDVDIPVWLFNGVGISMNMMKLLSFEKEFTEEVLIKITDHLIDSIRA